MTWNSYEANSLWYDSSFDDFRLSDNNAVGSFFSLVGQYSRWFRHREDTFRYFTQKYPDTVSTDSEDNTVLLLQRPQTHDRYGAELIDTKPEIPSKGSLKTDCILKSLNIACRTLYNFIRQCCILGKSGSHEFVWNSYEFQAISMHGKEAKSWRKVWCSCEFHTN